MSKKEEYKNELSKFLTNKAVGIEKLDPIPTKKIGKKSEKRNDLFASCYSLYLSGKSLRYIAHVHYRNQFTHQTLEQAFKVRGYKLRPKNLKKPFVYKGIKYREDGHGLYRSRKNGETVYLHRLIWEKTNGPMPKGFYIIFVDGNKKNIDIKNLQCIAMADAKKLYNNGNQFGYKRFPGRGAFGHISQSTYT